MSDIQFIKARLGKRDKDIKRAIKYLNLEEVILSDLVRDGFRLKLAEIGALSKPIEPITLEDARQIARELVNNLRAERR
ncbi:hypothetical protein [Desulfosporosinus sp. OT]|uniref:hypothetical protein n=1 Tax=Desulfosporosinus sp. OT TaxID=913865 RepID=UPI00058E1553|nr:hypothetical protein [Desulfosporosinus sp. OT]